MGPAVIPLVTTVKERCRVCFTCVRECPAKAIRIAGGQAEVIWARCIGCGNCVRVCSQGAKQVLDSVPDVHALLASGERVAACLAPSFPAEFSECSPERLIGMVRALGFDLVCEVAFGADLVAEQYRRFLQGVPAGAQHIATTCPAVVEYVERYEPHLTDALAPMVSPMVAMARCLHAVHGNDVRVVFIGPCIAKKQEVAGPAHDDVDAALTFLELRRMFREAGLEPETAGDAEFDPPHARHGGLFAISRGLLQVASIKEDLLGAQGVSVDGRSTFVEAIKEFEEGAVDAALLEVLACKGCVMGPGVASSAPLFSRQSAVSRYVRRRLERFDEAAWQQEMDRFAALDLGREFHPDDQRLPGPTPVELAEILARMGKHSPHDELNCGACGYDTCVEHAVAIHKELAESEMCLPYTIDELRRTVGELAVSNRRLASTQEALMQAEKLASMGQLAAGIAHEVNNPLGVVLMYTHLLLDDLQADSAMAGDLRVIAEQADRCKKIVAGLLNFARQSQVSLQPNDVREIMERSLRGVPAPDGVTARVETAGDDPIAELDRDQLTQVLTNLISNAYDAMPAGGELTLRVDGDAEQVVFSVRDTGVGIPEENMRRVFTPFFTTKPMGKGTGLGLAVVYGIVKMHRGDIRVESNCDPAAGPTGSVFAVTIPRHGVTD